MYNNEYKTPFILGEMVTLSLEKYSMIIMERDRLRVFKKLIWDNRYTPITKQEVEEYKEAAGI